MCGGSLHGESGFIQSPGYPKLYSANEECTWTIVTLEGNTVELTIDEFSLQSSSGCSKDYLQIHDGSSPYNRLLANLCGNVLTKKVYKSSGRTLLLRFKADGSGQSTGFKLSYKSGKVFKVLRSH